MFCHVLWRSVRIGTSFVPLPPMELVSTGALYRCQVEPNWISALYRLIFWSLVPSCQEEPNCTEPLYHLVWHNRLYRSILPPQLLEPISTESLYFNFRIQLFWILVLHCLREQSVAPNWPPNPLAQHLGNMVPIQWCQKTQRKALQTKLYLRW